MYNTIPKPHLYFICHGFEAGGGAMFLWRYLHMFILDAIGEMECLEPFF